MEISGGIYTPLITPFNNGVVDYQSLKNMVEYYLQAGVTGFALLGTTAETPTLEFEEQRKIAAFVLDIVEGKLPVYLGISGNATQRTVETLKKFEDLDSAGYLVVTPYYNRPSPGGLIEHFKQVSQATEKIIIVYNVPYRTGVNFGNDSLFELATSTSNVRAVKDATGNVLQTLDLLDRAPDSLSIFTGEDPLYFVSLTNGAKGGILASSHISPKTFVSIYNLILRQELIEARTQWSRIRRIIPYLFAESNPMPIKYCLWKTGIINSPECRLPLTGVSSELTKTLDHALETLP